MTMHTPKATRRAAGCKATLVVALLTATWAGKAAAQGSITGAADLGVRGFSTEPTAQQKARMLQYRSLSSGVLGQSLYARWSPRDSFSTLQFFGNRIGELDQSLSLRANHPGTADLQLRWDRAPHTFSTNARLLGTEASPGVYTLPTPRPDTATLNHSGYVAPVRTRWDPVRVSLTLTPGSAWDFKADYIHIGKTGQRPMGMAFGGSSNNAREILEPIDQTTQGFRVSQAYTQKRFSVRVMYDLSIFTNTLQSVTSDNPLVTVDSLRLGTSRGRTALAPDNRAQTLTSTATVNLPLRTRVTGTAAFGWWSQDQAFIPATINARNQDSLTRAGYVFPTSLNGRIHTSMANMAINSRPVKSVTVNAHYRHYAYKDLTDSTGAPILVISDRTMATGAARERFPWSRNNLDGAATLRLPRGFSVTGSYAWEQMNRDTAARNVGEVIEKTPRVSLDYNGFSWLTFRASYSHGTRRYDLYHQLTTSEMPEARRFDEADRDRNRLSFLVTANPVDQVTLMGTYDVGRDSFPNSAFGVQSDRNQAIGGEIDWSPISRFSVGGGILHEWNDNVFNGRYRTGSTTTTLANPTWVWIATNTDTSTTAYASFLATLIPGRLEAGGQYEVSKSRFRLMAVNPQTPTGGTTAQNTSATAMSFPTATQEFKPISLFARYNVSRDWGVTLRYTSESYKQYDFRTTGLNPATGNYIFLGNDLLPYDAKFFTMTVSFRPSLLRNTRAAM
jgi:MtrB/PioB family decaheme-associated outer membrane protein